tara:strand:- start:506 stop:709 length:204 start_codon:yes stop_codon:yes gene_type:complete
VPIHKKGKSGTKKYGRNKDKPSCQRYTREERWDKNKKKREWQTAKGFKKFKNLSKSEYFNLTEEERI